MSENETEKMAVSTASEAARAMVANLRCRDLRSSPCPCGSGKTLGECCSTGLWACDRCGKRFTLADSEPQACPHCAWRGVHLLRYSGGKPTRESVTKVKAALQRIA